MFGWTEICLLSIAAMLMMLRVLPYFKAYRPLFVGGSALMRITALFPRTGNPLGQFLFRTTGDGPRLPVELFGVLWWILGAWLFKSLLDLVLRRTFFPDNGEPHARRLFADLASGTIYILAFIGILGTVFKEPVSTFMATSGVLAIVLGLALQNTLGDVLSGLAINIERPFGAGDWITMDALVSGQVMQVNWRATRLRTWAHDMVVIPNSVISKAVVTNHSRPTAPHRCTIGVKIDAAVAPSRVIDALKAAAAASSVVTHGTLPEAYACAFSDSFVTYELSFSIDSFALSPGAKSDMLGGIVDTFLRLQIHIATAVPEMGNSRSEGPEVATSAPVGGLGNSHVITA